MHENRHGIIDKHWQPSNKQIPNKTWDYFEKFLCIMLIIHWLFVTMILSKNITYQCYWWATKIGSRYTNSVRVEKWHFCRRQPRVYKTGHSIQDFIWIWTQKRLLKVAECFWESPKCYETQLISFQFDSDLKINDIFEFRRVELLMKELNSSCFEKFSICRWIDQSQIPFLFIWTQHVKPKNLT